MCVYMSQDELLSLLPCEKLVKQEKVWSVMGPSLGPDLKLSSRPFDKCLSFSPLSGKDNYSLSVWGECVSCVLSALVFVLALCFRKTLVLC